MNKKAFTLIEVIIYISVLTIFMAAIIPFALNVIQTFAKNNTQEEVTAAARYMAERIKYEIRDSNGVDLANSNFGVDFATNSSYKLTLGNSNAVKNPTVFSVTSNKLQVKTAGGSLTNINSTDTSVTSLVFTNLSAADGSTKHITFTLKVSDAYTNAGQAYTANVTIVSGAEIRAN